MCTRASISAKHRLLGARTSVSSAFWILGKIPFPHIQFFQHLDIQFPALHFPLLQMPRVGCFPGQTQADIQLALQSEANQILPFVPPLSKNGWCKKSKCSTVLSLVVSLEVSLSISPHLAYLPSKLLEPSPLSRPCLFESPLTCSALFHMYVTPVCAPTATSLYLGTPHTVLNCPILDWEPQVAGGTVYPGLLAYLALSRCFQNLQQLCMTPAAETDELLCQTLSLKKGTQVGSFFHSIFPEIN